MSMAQSTSRPVTIGSWLPTVLVLGAVGVALALSVEGLGGILPRALWWQAIWAPDVHDIRQIVVHDSWLPRLLVSWLCGALLGLAGTIFQQVLRNPLAEPMTLGISAGAQLALTLVTVWAPALLDAQEWVALAGAALAAAIVFGLSWRNGLAPATVAVTGLCVSMYCGSIGVAFQLFQAPYLRRLFIWGGGSLVQQDWHNVSMLGSRLLVGGVVAITLLRPMRILGLDDASAQGLGISLRRLRIAALALSVVLSAAVVSAVGVIGFVGLAAPALASMAGARRLSDRLFVAPLCGALILWLTDQTVQRFSDALGDLIPTGAATALFGAPLLLLLLARTHRTTRLPLANTAMPGGTHSRQRVLHRFILLSLLVALALILALDVAPNLGQDARGWHLSTVDELSRMMIWRAPRALSALAAGIMLAIAGTLMQRLTGNPLASPEVLGVSAGAALGMIVLVYAVGNPDQGTRIVVTSLSAFAALLAMLWFSRQSQFAPDRVLVAGVAIGALFQALVAVVISSGGEHASALLQWLSGSTYSITPNAARYAIALCIVLVAATPLCGRWLQILPLGETSARGLGVDTRIARLALLIMTALLTAAATLIVGPLSFVGLTAPHFARLLGARRALHQIVLTAPTGALLMVVADWLGRVMLSPRELPAGLVATLLGAPYLMWLLSRRR